MTVNYSKYEHLKFDRPHPGVLRITIATGLKMNSMDARTHLEVAGIWSDVEADTSVAVAIITGEGRHFSTGGNLATGSRAIDDYGVRVETMRRARQHVLGMINCSKPIVSAARGWTMGAGLVCALLADISIFSKTAKIMDGHTKIGLAAGDHAAIIWPLLCGMAKAKYYLLTCDHLTGEEAERIGLVSLAVDDSELDQRALAVACRLADGAQSAIRWTKRSLNLWLKQSEAIFETSLAYEFLGFSGTEAREGIDAFLNKRPAKFPTDVEV